MATVIVPLAEGFEEIEAITVIDVLRRGGVQVTTAAVGNQIEVPGAHGVAVSADELLEDVKNDDFDAIVLPGGPGTENLRNSDTVIAMLQRQKEAGRLLCAICAAPLVLVDADVLEPGQHVTCYPTCVIDLDRPAANVPAVADGNVITGQAPGAAMLFALVVLRALAGDKAAQKVVRALVTDVIGG